MRRGAEGPGAPVRIEPLAALQRAFAAALMRPDGEIPAAVAPAVAAQRLRRFNVYRNNVKASLAAVLEARFPVVRRLVGEEFFRATALVFIERTPPASPVLAEYGGGFACFLDGFEPAADLPYLPDIARLEWRRHAAYHAADAPAAGLGDLAAVPEAALGGTVLALHPAAGVVASAYPIVSLWRTNMHDAEVRPLSAAMGGEAALVARPGLEVLVEALPPGADAFFDALAQGEPLGPAAARGSGTAEAFDLPLSLALLFRLGAVSRVRAPAAGDLSRDMP